MKEKKWGTILIIIAIVMTITSIMIKIYRDVLNGCISCSYFIYAIIWFIAGLLLVIGMMLKRSNELEDIIAESRLKVNKEFEEAKKKEREKEKFQGFLKDFNESEKEVIEIIHTFEGISQRELEKKLNYTDDKMNRILKSLEKKEILTIMDSDKIYLLKFSK